MAKKQSSSKPKPTKPTTSSSPESPTSYTHPEQQVAMRPDIGTQDKFRKKKAPATYRYDSSLSPALDSPPLSNARARMAPCWPPCIPCKMRLTA